jgi:hypothetical protein
MRDALSRAAAEPEGCALLATRTEPGLFPATAPARTAAERCKDEGYLQVVRTERKGKSAREICVLTDKGRDFLARHANPREVLEDFVRVLESRQAEMQAMAATLDRLRQSCDAMRSTAVELLPRLAEAETPGRNGSYPHGAHMNGSTTLLAPPPPSATTATDALIAEVKAKLAEWHASAGGSEDCPLPELYRRLESAGAVSIGQFHDCLRQLHDDRIIYLHPWTGPLYALPEPAFALLVGHEIGYYVSIR